MTLKPGEHQCEESVFADWHSHQCPRRGVVERNGKWYCKQHDPVAIAEKDAARERQWEAERAARWEADKRDKRIHKFYADMESIYEEMKHFDPILREHRLPPTEFSSGLIFKMWERLREEMKP